MDAAMTTVLNPNDPNVFLLERVAASLSADLRTSLVFVGGAVVGLLITDAAMPAIRPTEDVDLVAQVLARADFHRLEQALMALGFVQDLRRDAPICRWRVGGVTVDVMPTLEEILGFANRWYPLAVATGQPMTLPSGLVIHVVRAPVFMATKLVAFDGRGQGDFLFSHDLGDVISVVDGRESLVAECRDAPAELRGYLGQRFQMLLASRSFREALPGHLPGDAASQERVPELEAKLKDLAQLTSV